MKKSILMVISFFIVIAFFINIIPSYGMEKEATNNLISSNYNEYFSVERQFEDLSLNNCEGYNFLIDEEGRLIKHCDSLNPLNDKDYKVVIYDDEVVNCFFIVLDKIIFVTNHKKIYQSDLDGSNSFLEYEFPDNISGNISQIYADNDLIWLKLSDKIYRLHRQSGIMDLFFENKKMISFYPLSNYVIKFTEPSEEWENFISKGNHEHTGVSFSETVMYTYNYKTDEICEYTNAIVDNRDSTRSITHYTSYSLMLNNKIIPASGYGLTRYIGESNSSKCNHHTLDPKSIEANCEIGVCDCQVLGQNPIGTGIQCFGFASEIYYYLFDGNYETIQTGISISGAAGAKTFLQNLHPGAYIRSNGHSLILLKTTSTYADFYHANFEEPCKVSISKFEYADFASRYSYITNLYNGCHTYNITSQNNVYHFKTCSFCGNATPERHTFVDYTNRQVCAVCGYTIYLNK